MNQSIMNKTLLASAIALSLAGTNAQAADAPTINSIKINNMSFGDNFTAGGFLNRLNVPGPTPIDEVNNFDPVVGPPAGRALKSGVDPLNFTGTIFSLDNFNGHSWLGTQQTIFFDNTGQWANCSGGTPGTGGCADGSVKSSGVVSPQGDYDFDTEIQAMVPGQIAVGIFFDWYSNNGIALLEIFTCDDVTHVCTGQGVPMKNGPFAGETATFSGGPAPLSCPETPSFLTTINQAFDIAINDVMAVCTDSLSALTLVSFDDISANGGVITSDGATFNYSPVDGFEGPDSFNATVQDSRSAPVNVVINVQVGHVRLSNFTMLASDGSTMFGSNDVDVAWDEVTFNSAAILPSSDQGDPDQAGLEGFGIPTDSVGVMTVASPQKISGFNWFANNVRVYKGPVKLRFDISCTLDDYSNNVVDCQRSLPVGNIGKRYIAMELKEGEIGGHMIFGWGSADASTPCGLANCDIDVINVWAQNVEWYDPDGFGGINEIWVGAAGIPPANNNPVNGGAAKWALTPIDSDGDGVTGQRMIDGTFVGASFNINSHPEYVEPPIVVPPPPPPSSGVKADAFAANIWSLLAGFLSLIGLRKVSRDRP